MVWRKIIPIEKELQRAKEDLEGLEFFIREFTAFLPLAVCTVNPVGIVIDVNKAFSDLTGYKSGEIVGEFLMTIFLEKKEVEKMLEAMVGKKIKVSKDLTLITKQKEKVLASVAISSREDKEGNFIGYFVGITDITELKKLQEKLEEKVKERTEEFQEKVEELEKFHKLAVGRELKMIELKDKIKKLEEELKKYKVVSN